MSFIKLVPIEVPSGRVYIWGENCRCGFYILRMRVARLLRVTFGSFNDGRPITVEPGEYAYVGSAMGRRGGFGSLSTRLLDHATRTGDRPPQLIRDLLAAELYGHRMFSGKRLPKSKRPHYHAGWLLDSLTARLASVYARRTDLSLEKQVGKWLELDRQTRVFSPGLGATDVDDNTHLLRVKADEAWWSSMPARIDGFVRGGAAMERLRETFGNDAVNAAWEARHPTASAWVTISNMHRDRAAAILAELASGVSFTKANEQTKGVCYDTTGSGEIISRLARARGAIDLVSRTLGAGAGTLVLTRPQRTSVNQHVKRIIAQTAECLARLDKIRTEKPATRARPRKLTDDPSRNTAATFRALRGYLRRCLTFIAKNSSDLTLIVEKTGSYPSPAQADVIRAELKRIGKVAKKIGQLVDRGR